MSDESYQNYARIAEVTVRVSLIALRIAFIAACVVALHFTVLLARAASLGAGARANPRADAVVLGLTVAGSWTFLAFAIVVALGGPHLWWLGLVIGAPLGAVVGWHSGVWQEASSWSRVPNASVLGQWKPDLLRPLRPYTVTPRERTMHVALSGATGTGKSTLIRNLVLQDLCSGAGLCVIDPKDDLIDGLLPLVPPERLDDVILFDAADVQHPLGLNPFTGVPSAQRSIAAAELIAVFRRYFADAWGARLEHILRNVVLALLETPGASLVDVPRLLLDRTFGRWVLDHVTNPAVREFLEVEYEQVLKRRSDAIASILNKVGPWLSYPELRAIISQPESSFEMRQVMDEGKVLLVRIPQGVFGEDVSNLLGALIVAKVQLAAQTRVGLPAAARRPFYLYVDEFQNFATSSFNKVLTEARAFNLGLVCVNQYPEQLSRQLQQAIANNAATFVRTVQKEGRYRLEVTRREDLDEKPPPVYVVEPAPPPSRGDPERAAEIRRRSRERYGPGRLRESQTTTAAASTDATGPPKRQVTDIEEE
ncbi:MAG: ATP-binding protein [Chloroflexi bacterium]|nr:ATP-binding protein [Chloroflexota bacterium]